jgi:hypothetical protein
MGFALNAPRISTRNIWRIRQNSQISQGDASPGSWKKLGRAVPHAPGQNSQFSTLARSWLRGYFMEMTSPSAPRFN